MEDTPLNFSIAFISENHERGIKVSTLLQSQPYITCESNLNGSEISTKHYCNLSAPIETLEWGGLLDCKYINYTIRTNWKLDPCSFKSHLDPRLCLFINKNLFSFTLTGIMRLNVGRKLCDITARNNDGFVLLFRTLYTLVWIWYNLHVEQRFWGICLIRSFNLGFHDWRFRQSIWSDEAGLFKQGLR